MELVGLRINCELEVVDVVEEVEEVEDVGVVVGPVVELVVVVDELVVEMVDGCVAKYTATPATTMMTTTTIATMAFEIANFFSIFKPRLRWTIFHVTTT